MGILPLLSDINENFSLNESKQDPEFAVVPDTLQTGLLIKVDSFYLDIIPPSVGVQFYKDGIVFLASTKNTVKMVPEHISFGSNEAYFAVPGDSTIGMKTPFSANSSFKYPCDALTFSSDFKTMYFTRPLETNSKEKIYQAVISSGNNTQTGWSENTEPLVFCNDNSNYSHPSISVNGESMIFASDRKGTAGGMDLFISKKEGKSWSTPENLGNEINTKGNELFPFLDSDNNLFFSSNGLPGLGGFDIFTCKFNGKSWDKPLNLTQLINSAGDELAFTMSKSDGKTGFFTSRQKSGKKIKQLYKVTLNRKYVVDNHKSISDVLYNAVLNKPELTAMNSNDSTDLIKTIVNEEKKEVKPVEIPAKTEKVPEPKIENAELKVITPTVATLKTEVKKQVVTYRIQFASTNTSKGTYKITVNNKSYNTFEYFYKGAYRSTVGDFNILSEAKAFQTTLRQSGYPNAFVVAFVDGERSLDPTLFK